MILPARTLEEAKLLAQAIVNTIPQPFLLLDASFHVLAASRAFYEVFQVTADETQGHLLYALGDGQWDIPALRLLLETIIPDRAEIEGFEVEHNFPGLGLRVMMLNALKVRYETSADITILLAFQDITARRAIEREKELILQQSQDLVREKQTMLEEMRHRVANSLQIIASILMLKARAVSSTETRHHLEDAHQRVMSVAAVQQYLNMVEGVDEIEVSDYLDKLTAGLSASMVSESQPVMIEVTSDKGMIPSAKAVSIGLIVTELFINALKYAFPQRRDGALISVSYEIAAEDWKLTVSDNGGGKVDGGTTIKSSGLGTTIVSALAKQLEASVEQVSNAAGHSVSVTRATFKSRLPDAA